MGDAVKVLFLILSALYPTVDPLSGGPIFLALTREYSPQMRRRLSWRVAVDSLLLLLGAYFVGSHVLKFFAVSLPVVQVGGGMVVISMGWKMLMDDKEEGDNLSSNHVGPSDIYGRAFYPLTLPLTVGPGSISIAITLGANSTHRYGVHVSIVLAAITAMALLAASIFLVTGSLTSWPECWARRCRSSSGFRLFYCSASACRSSGTELTPCSLLFSFALCKD